MIKKEKNKKKFKSQFLVIGSLSILIGISIIGYHIYSDYRLKNIEDNNIQEFFNEEQKEENKLILPVSGGYVSSEFGARESTSEIVSTNHKGIDIAVVERYRCSFSNVWPCYKSNGV